MIKEFYLKICTAYEEKGLIPFPGRQARDKVLIFENPIDGSLTHNININGGHLLIDLNDSYRISSLELGIYRKNWTFLNEELFRPQPAIKGCLEFVNIKSRINEFDEFRLHVCTDKRQSAVKIEIGDYDRANSLWIAISSYCIAELVDNFLAGFWIDISDY